MNERISVAFLSYWQSLCGRLSAYAELTKPRLTLLAVFSTLWGFYLGSVEGIHLANLINTGWASLLVGGGANALNQFFERDMDRSMKRTEKRPLPTRRLTEEQAFNFGVFMSVVGMMHLAIFVNPLSSLVALGILFSYLILYTPFKRRSPLAVFVGAVPGALPPVMGWAAANSNLDLGAWILFSIVFVWQIPHFLAIAWLYREDYENAHLPVWASQDPKAALTARTIAVCSAILLVLSLLPVFAGMAGAAYFASALIAGILFICASLMRSVWGPAPYARRLFLASVVYLPVLMIMMIWDKV